MRDCIHWEPNGTTRGKCLIGRFGGRPSLGTCTQCTDRNEADADIHEVQSGTMVPPRMAPMIAWRVAANTSVCQSCTHYQGVNPNLTIQCGKCGCEQVPPWNSDNCPMGLWRHAHRRWPAQTLRYRGPSGEFVHLNGMYDGMHAFITCPGPSLCKTARSLQDNLDYDSAPGLLTMGLNNSPAVIRPNLWCAVDPNKTPHGQTFLPSIWQDPGIMKFYPTSQLDQVDAGVNLWGYVPTQPWKWWRYFSEERVVWGNNVLVIAIRILYDLGVRVVYLLGADFHMDVARPYAFDESVPQSHADSNNRSYEMLNDRFAVLRPLLEHHGLTVYNCTPDSNLTAFDHMDYNEAWERMYEHQCVDVTEESTLGRYCGMKHAPVG